LLYVPTIWTIVATAQRIQRGQRLVGNPDVMNGWGLAALWVFTLGLGAFVYMQVCMNRIWRSEGEPIEQLAQEGNADLERLAQLHELKKSGALTQKEFAAEKARILPSKQEE
jgi:hypothetical protein